MRFVSSRVGITTQFSNNIVTSRWSIRYKTEIDQTRDYYHVTEGYGTPYNAIQNKDNVLEPFGNDGVGGPIPLSSTISLAID